MTIEAKSDTGAIQMVCCLEMFVARTMWFDVCMGSLMKTTSGRGFLFTLRSLMSACVWFLLLSRRRLVVEAEKVQIVDAWKKNEPYLLWLEAAFYTSLVS